MQDCQQDYFNLAIPAAQACQRETGVPASVTIAQGALESGWGRTRLATEFCNYFGIKANQEQLADDDYCEFKTNEEINGSLVEISAKFAQYATPEESFVAHGTLLLRPNYAPAMAVKDDVDKFCHMLGPKPNGCGYSTLKAYGDLLMQLIKGYNLTQYDKETK